MLELRLPVKRRGGGVRLGWLADEFLRIIVGVVFNSVSRGDLSSIDRPRHSSPVWQFVSLTNMAYGLDVLRE